MAKGNKTSYAPNGKVFVILIFGLGFLFNKYISSPKKIVKQKQEMIDEWGRSTASYFEDFKCKDLLYLDKYHYIDRFIVVESDLDKDCELKKYKGVFEEKTLKIDFKKFNKYTKNIDEANTIIWIRTKLGEVEAKYGKHGLKDGIRLVSEVNFIDKETKRIYKSVIIKHIGSASDKVRVKRSNASKPVYIGGRDREGIERLIAENLK